MSTWGSGLWDNDATVDVVGTLVKISPAKETMPLLASWGLRLWFGQADAKAFAKGIERKSAELIRLPKPLFQELVGLAQRPTEYARRNTRPAEHTAILGSSCDGYFVAPLFELPDVKAVVENRAEELSLVLDKFFGGTPKPEALYKNKLAPLGVLLTFTRIGIYVAPARADAWLAGFERMVEAAKSEGEFWKDFSGRVRPLFTLIKAKR
jgi:hypothetical protein